MSETKKFLKKNNQSIPKGWRRMRLGEKFYPKYGYIPNEIGKEIQISNYINSNLRQSLEYKDIKTMGGIYLKLK